jgi:hypothetical protein
MDIYEACKTGNIKFIKKFITLRPGLNKNVHLPPIINALNQVDNYISQKTPLMIACINNHLDIVRELLNIGVNVNKRNKDGMTELMLSNNVEIIRELINHGADINILDRNGNTALMLACINNHLDIVRELINLGINVNIQNKEGRTALMLSNNIEIVLELINRGADINVLDRNGNTALLLVNNVEILHILINRGADINLRNRNGNTILMNAVNTENYMLVQELINMGFNINLRNNSDETALDIAKENTYYKNTLNNSKIIQLLSQPIERPPLSLRLKPEDYSKYINTTDDSYCSICLVNYNAQPISILEPCNHIFHSDCINQEIYRLNGLHQTHKCPKCRETIVRKNNITIDTTPGEPSLNKVFFGGYYNKLQKYLNKL